MPTQAPLASPPAERGPATGAHSSSSPVTQGSADRVATRNGGAGQGGLGTRCDGAGFCKSMLGIAS